MISRSIRKLKVFKDREDFEAFKRELLIEKRKSGFRIFHYCLMQTHFHLAVEIPNVVEFSKSLARVKSRYTSIFHTKYRLSGPIWRERYKSLLIENEEYLLACGQYIEANPVKAEMVKKNEDWPYSSHRVCHQGISDELVDEYGDIESIRRKGILDDLIQEDFESGSIIGSAFFKFQFFERRKRR
ncbi:MAG TPA: transposase [Candidatus Omnitrophota bacterium]|nr:transposase [Candidatus Omnitrophota bacterium]